MITAFMLTVIYGRKCLVMNLPVRFITISQHPNLFLSLLLGKHCTGKHIFFYSYTWLYMNITVKPPKKLFGELWMRGCDDFSIKQWLKCNTATSSASTPYKLDSKWTFQMWIPCGVYMFLFVVSSGLFKTRTCKPTFFLTSAFWDMIQLSVTHNQPKKKPINKMYWMYFNLCIALCNSS